MAAFEAWLVFLILVVNVVSELLRKRILAASRGFLAATRLSCIQFIVFDVIWLNLLHVYVCSLAHSIKQPVPCTRLAALD